MYASYSIAPVLPLATFVVLTYLDINHDKALSLSNIELDMQQKCPEKYHRYFTSQARLKATEMEAVAKTRLDSRSRTVVIVQRYAVSTVSI